MEQEQEQNANRLARDQAFEAAGRLSVEPTSRVSYQSEGRALVIGFDEVAALEAARRLADRLTPTVLLTGSGTSREVEGLQVLYTQGRTPMLEGYLGQFLVTLKVGEQIANVATLRDSGWDRFDVILDLGTAPLFVAELPPVGYFAPAFGDAEALDHALAAAGELIGGFEKPKFFDYDPEICAHGRRGVAGCTRCLDACPALAIHSLGETIEVNPHLCQGGGICASVCPTGAIIYSYPKPSDLLERLRTLLATYREAGGVGPVVLFYDDETGAEELARLEPLPAHVFAVEVDEVGSVGLDVLLACLAYGAREVVLLETDALPRKVRRNLNEQIGYAQGVLEAMGYPRNALALAPVEACRDRPHHPMPEVRHATFPGSNRKRETLFRALDHLNLKAPSPQEAIALPRGAPFGEIRVDRKACTLCMACVAVCPAKALATPGDRPRLDFTELNCVQCGLCEQACPEQAIRLEPRLITSPAARSNHRALNEEAPFDCVSCGKPFATRSMIERMTARLADHWMFKDEASLRRLQMCEDCRVTDMFRDQAKGAGNGKL